MKPVGTSPERGCPVFSGEPSEGEINYGDPNDPLSCDSTVIGISQAPPCVRLVLTRVDGEIGTSLEHDLAHITLSPKSMRVVANQLLTACDKVEQGQGVRPNDLN